MGLSQALVFQAKHFHTVITNPRRKSPKSLGEQYHLNHSTCSLQHSHRSWRERRDLALQHRADTADKKKAETIKAAQTAIDDFYENYNTKKDKTIAQTRKEAEEFLANREDTSAGGTSWERIAKLVDLSGKGAKGGASGTGKERFRELLVALKKDEKAPGAAGV